MGCGSSTIEVRENKNNVQPIKENNVEPIKPNDINDKPPESEEENSNDPYRFLKTKNYDNSANQTNGKKEGGKIKYSNGNYYQGEEKNGKRQGKGIL